MSEKLTIANPEDGNRPLSYQAPATASTKSVWVTWASRTRCGAGRTASSWRWPVESSTRRPDDERPGLRTARERLPQAELGELPRGFMVRLILWAVVFAFCIGWVMSHAGCAHPIGNGLASLVGFGCAPLRLLCLVLSEAGVE